MISKVADPPSHIIAATLPVDIGKRVGLPEIGQRQNALLGFLGSRFPVRLIGQIDIKHV